MACSFLSQPHIPEHIPGWEYNIYPKEHMTLHGLSMGVLFLDHLLRGEAQLCHITAAVGVGTTWMSTRKLLPVWQHITVLRIYWNIHLRSLATTLGGPNGRFHWALFSFSSTSKHCFTFHLLSKYTYSENL